MPQKPYAERPRRVLADQYRAATNPEPVGLCDQGENGQPCAVNPSFPGTPHVHGDGQWYPLAEGDWIVFSEAMPEQLPVVMTDAEFSKLYGVTITNQWKYRSNTNINDPSNGNVRLNASALPQATGMALSTRPTTGGEDVAADIAAALPGDQLEIQAVTDLTRWAEYELTTVPIMHNGWAQLGLVHRSSANPVFTDAEVVTIRIVPR